MKQSKDALTLVELLVVMVIVAILAGLLLVGVQQIRISARRIECSNRLRQIGIASLNFESSRNRMPSLSWLTDISQFIEFNLLVKSTSISSQTAFSATSNFRCPADDFSRLNMPLTSYFGNLGTVVDADWTMPNGTILSPTFFARNRLQESDSTLPEIVHEGISIADISDGISNTSMYCEALFREPNERQRVLFYDPNFVFDGTAEKVDEFVSLVRNAPNRFVEGDFFPGLKGEFLIDFQDEGWEELTDLFTNTYNHVLSPQQPSGLGAHPGNGVMTASSAHPGGVNLVFADGHVEFVSSSIEETLWQQKGNRKDQ